MSTKSNIIDETNFYQGNNCLDLSYKKLVCIPSEVLVLSSLKELYLANNKIDKLNDELFVKLPSLQWLDLRNNCITKVPCNVGKHKFLQNLLLECNNVKELPAELGMVKSLSGLSLRGNPLSYPPPNVVNKGVLEIKNFLKTEYLKSKESVTIPAKDTDVLNGNEEKFDIPSNKVNCAVIQSVEDQPFFLEEKPFLQVTNKLPERSSVFSKKTNKNVSLPAKSRVNKVRTKPKIQLPDEKDNNSALPTEILNERKKEVNKKKVIKRSIGNKKVSKEDKITFERRKRIKNYLESINTPRSGFEEVIVERKKSHVDLMRTSIRNIEEINLQKLEKVSISEDDSYDD